jgi:hypothetical protein
MPMPLAAALYGVLLGLGVTTFVLSFGVWALAGVSLAVGDPALGLVLGAAFGIGRAIPIVVLAPISGSDRGLRARELMCERDSTYLNLRRGDAAALLLAAVALVVAPGSAGAARTQVSHATDPSATGDALLFQRLGGPAVISRGGPEIPLPGKHPAIGGRFVTTITGDSIQLLDRNSLAPVAQLPAPGADAVAVSDSWLAYRAPAGGGDGIYIRYIANPASPAPPLLLASEGGASQLSPPSIDGSILLYAIATPRGSRVVQWVMGTHKHRTLVRSRRLLLFDPAVDGRSFAYVRSDARRSRLMVRGRHRHGAGRILFTLKRANGVLYSDALTDAVAYVTVLKPDGADADASIVGAMAHGVLMVVRAGRAERDVVRAAYDQLTDVGATLVGAALNDPDGEIVRSGGAYYFYGYAGVHGGDRQ